LRGVEVSTGKFIILMDRDAVLRANLLLLLVLLLAGFQF